MRFLKLARGFSDIVSAKTNVSRLINSGKNERKTQKMGNFL